MKNIQKSFSVLAAALAIFVAALVSCAPEPQAKAAASIAANQITIFEVGANNASVKITALEGLNAGDTKTLLVEVQPANATDKAVTWSSSNPAVAVIDAGGKLTAQASGNATITASAGGAAATLSVSVAYSVTNETQLRDIAKNLAGYYVLKNEITLTQEWTPLGEFTGTLDGAGYSVKKLEINKPAQNIVGFIAENSGTIKNIGLELGSQGVSGGKLAIGSLVGVNRGTVSGRVTTMNNGKVTGLGNTTGGLVGENVSGTVIGYATVTVESNGTGGTGGLVGQSYNSGALVVGYATGNVSGTVSVGGLVGFIGGGATVIGYARGAVLGTNSEAARTVNRIGGLIGTIAGGAISGYSRGAVSTDRATTNIGPAVGDGDAASAANIYYSGKSGESGFTYTGSSGTVTPNTLGKQVSVAAGEEFGTTTAKFSNFASPSIAQYWTMNGGKWPAINFPADTIFDDVRTTQPVGP